jgi:uncharacterized delta-60 repeat protein
MRRALVLVSSVLGACLLLFVGLALAAPGDPDTSIGSNGIMQWSPGVNSTVHGYAAAVDSNHKIVVVGKGGTTSLGQPEGLIARFNTDGSLDTSFANGAGYAYINLTDYGTVFNSVVIQPNGKIVVGGNYSASPGYGVVARFTSDGKLDNTANSGSSSFGGGSGYTTIGAGYDGCSNGHDNVIGVGLQSNRIIATTNHWCYQSSMDKYWAYVWGLTDNGSGDGTLDTSFGSSGKRKISHSSVTADEPYQMSVCPNGKILVTGWAYTSRGSGNSLGWPPSSTFVEQLTSSGAEDTGYGPNSNGYLTAFSSPQDYPAVTCRSDNSTIVSGFIQNGSNYEARIKHYDTSGTADNSFGSSGTATIAWTSSGSPLESDPSFLAPLAGNQVAVGGLGYPINSHMRWTTAVLNADGSLFGGYGSGGKTAESNSAQGSLYGLATGPSQELVQVGDGSSGKLQVEKHTGFGPLSLSYPSSTITLRYGSTDTISSSGNGHATYSGTTSNETTTFTASGLPSGVSPDSSGNISWTPTDPGASRNQYNATITATTYVGGVAQRSVSTPLTINVLPKSPDQFRPMMWFDTTEPYRPLDVEKFLAEGATWPDSAHELCHPATPSGATCTPITSVSDLNTGTANPSSYWIDVNGTTVDDATTPNPTCNRGVTEECINNDSTSLYYHHVHDSTAGYDYYDYWAFYRFNHFYSPVYGDDHDGDWEHIVVAVNSSTPTYFDWVGFSAHNNVWKYLRDTLYCDGTTSDGSCETTLASRPVAFIANGSHASYPRPCSADCHQVEPLIPERTFDGGAPWERDNTTSALQELPASGTPWSPDGSGNYTGQWGDWNGAWGSGSDSTISGGVESPGSRTEFNDPGGEVSCADNYPTYSCTSAPYQSAPNFFASTGGQAAGASSDPCAPWEGPFVVVAICNPSELSQHLSKGSLRENGEVRIHQAGPDNNTVGSAPGLTQVLANRPLHTGDELKLNGALTPGASVLVRVLSEGKDYNATLVLPAQARSAPYLTLKVQAHAGSAPSVGLENPAGKAIAAASAERGAGVGPQAAANAS